MGENITDGPLAMGLPGRLVDARHRSEGQRGKILPRPGWLKQPLRPEAAIIL